MLGHKKESEDQSYIDFMNSIEGSVPLDLAEAEKLYLKAAEQGNTYAQYSLGNMYWTKNHAEALEWYRKAAEQGYERAQSYLAFLYSRGEVIPQDLAESARWYRKAAEQGNAHAQFSLGEMYRTDKGVPKNYVEAAKWYRKAADQEKADAQFWLGWMYINGRGVPQSDTDAVKWYRKAASQENADAQFWLGWMYQNGRGVPQSDDEAVKWFRKAAEQENTTAQNWLGWMYQNGKGISQDDNEAVEWYRKAAEKESADAQRNLGWMYINGRGVPQSDAEAVKWFRRAIKQGNPSAQFWLGWMYRNGRGVPQSDDEAVKWYREAANQGHAEAQFQLGNAYYYGRGVSEDEEEAVAWYQKSAAQGNAEAQCKLGNAYCYGWGVPENEEEAVAWYKKSAAQGNAEAQCKLGNAYHNGRVVPANDKVAKMLYQMSANKGNAEAQCQLGNVYNNGWGVPEDEKEAVAWYQKSAAQGNAEAQYQLGQMYYNGWGVPQDEEEAIVWFQKAADQGHADAKSILAKVSTDDLILGNSTNKSYSQREERGAISNQSCQISGSIIKSQQLTEECKALLDACTPHLYEHNFFRISGINVDTSKNQIKRRIDELKAAAENGDLEDELTHAYAIDPVPSLDQIREAALRVQNPEQQIINEFFWFWPYEWGKGTQDSALLALMNGDKNTAIKIWTETLGANHTPTVTTAKHNLAILYHLNALDLEKKALEDNLSNEQFSAIAKNWHSSFMLWEDLVDSEPLWDMVADRIRMLDDPRITTGFARRFRATLPDGIDKINAILATDFADCGKWDNATKHINYVKETHQGKYINNKILSNITEPYRTRVSSAIEKALPTAKKTPLQAAQAAKELLQAISEPLKIVEAFLSVEDHERIDLCDSVAEACLTCQVAYARESEDWSGSLEILNAALKYAASKETKERLLNNRSNVAVNMHIGSLMKKISEIEELNISVADKMNNVRNNVIPHLSNIKTMPGVTEDVYQTCADSIARYIRDISVSVYNKTNDLIGALCILEVSISVACGEELCELLKEDKDHLLNIQNETAKHNLSIQIRSDQLDITKEFIRYNDKNIFVSNILGIKYGVLIQTVNGVRSSSYSIDIVDGQSKHINIECKRFFRSEAQAEQDFNRILEALYHQVIPSLVYKIAKNIVAGRNIQVGDCRLTKEGMYITTGALFWKKETLLSYTQLKFTKGSGKVNVYSTRDYKINASMAIRDIYNAALLEFIVDQVVEIIAKS